MLALGEDGVRDRIKTLNFLNTKARNVVALSRRLVEEHGGKVPSSIEVLQTLPGVGRKSASVVANIAFGEPRIAVDTHIFRVANRIPLVATDNPLDTQEQLERIVPEEFRLNAHHWLILHGRYTCVARAPKCAECVILDLCEFRHKNLPNPKPVATTARKVVPAASLPPPRARGRQPMAKTARAGAKRGRGR